MVYFQLFFVLLVPLASLAGYNETLKEPLAAFANSLAEQSEKKRAVPYSEGNKVLVQKTVAQKGNATSSPKTAPSSRHDLPFELSKTFLLNEANAKAALLLAKLRYDIDSSSVEPMVQTIDKWLLDTSLPPKTRQLLQFVKQEVLPSLAEAKTSILANKDSLIGIKLKNQNMTEEVITSLDFDTIKLTQTTSRGTLDRTLTWDVFRKEGLLVELCKHLLEKGPTKPNNSKPYLAVLLFCGQAPIVASFLQSANFRDYTIASNVDTLNNWFLLGQIQRFLTPTTKEIVELMSALRISWLNANDYLAASTIKKILAADKKAALLSEADQRSLINLLDRLSYALPEIQAGKLAREAKELQRQAKYNAALHTALTTFNRFGRIKFPEKNLLDETIENGFEQLHSPIELHKNTLANAIPFFNHYPPAHNLVLCRNASAAFESELEQKAMESMFPLARFAFGDWSQANTFLSSEKPFPYPFDKAPKDTQEAATFALLFAKTLYEARFSETPINSKFFAPFVKKLQRTTPPNAQTMALLSAIPLMLYGLKAPDKLPLFTPSPNLEQQFLTEYNYAGSAQARRTVFYQCYTLILEYSPSEHFRTDLQAKLQDNTFLDGYGFQGTSKRFLERLVNYDGNPAECPLEHIIDRDIDWAFLRAWIASANTPEGLSDKGDAAFLAYADAHAPNWPLQGGETIMAWLLARCSFCLNHGDLETAEKLLEQILAMNHACLIRYYPSLLALDASIKALNGKQGGIQTSADLLVAAPISPKYERAAFRALADLQPEFSTTKFNQLLASLPKNKESTFWVYLMGTSIAYNFPHEPSPMMPDNQASPSLALLAKAFARYIQRR